MNEESVKRLIAEVLEVSLDTITNDLSIGDIPEWDSLAHMKIIAALESSFEVILDIEQTLEIEDVDDILDVVLGDE